VLGDFSLSNVVVTAGKTLKLGTVTWSARPPRSAALGHRRAQPRRFGILQGDDYFHWGWYIQYAKLFPNDVNYVIWPE